jgi:hypothetical protein
MEQFIPSMDYSSDVTFDRDPSRSLVLDRNHNIQDEQSSFAL